MDDKDALKPVLSAEDVNRERLNKYWLDYSLDYPEPHYFLQYNGVPFSPLGGLQAMTGHQKNGKTFVLAQFMATVLQPDAPRVRSFLYGLQAVPETLEYLGHEPRVLYIDTEMENLNTAKVARRVQWLCGWPKGKKNDRFGVLWLRGVDDDPDVKTERWQLTKEAIVEFVPDFVVLDGLVDIVHDFNNIEESNRIIQEIMNIASNRDICIWTALHQNPGQDALGKMRGHLGTELANKSSDTFVSIKERKGTETTFTIKQINARNKDVDDWKFQITEDAGKLGVPRIIDNAAEQDRKQQRKIEVNDIFEPYKWKNTGARFSDLAPYLSQLGYSSTRKQYNLLNEAEEYGILTRNQKTKVYYYNGLKPSKEYAEGEAFPPAAPNDKCPY